MKMKKIILILLIFITTSCSTWKANLSKIGDSDNAIENAILDFLNTSKYSEGFNTFHIIKISNNNTIGISIIGDDNKWLLEESKIGEKNNYFPSKFREIDGKLFYWNDSDIVVNSSIIDVMNKYGILEIQKKRLNEIPEGLGNSSKKAVHYYFCKINLLKYKKVNSTISIGYYKPPRIICQ